MAYPEWVEKQRRKGTNISCIRGKYYLYACTSKYDPIKKRARKITGEYLGRITEDGLIPPKRKKNEIKDDEYAMVGYLCGNTLSENGTVTRGVCRKDEDGWLTDIVEIKEIYKKDGKAVCNDNGAIRELAEDDVVSMNFWGFTPKIFEEAMPVFDRDIHQGVVENPLKCESLIPTTVGELVKEGVCKVKVLSSKDRWFGVTYKEDKPDVMARIQEMKDNGIYPDILW